MQDDKDPLSRKYYRYHSNKKGKAEGVNDKIKSAGVGDWVDQKLHKFSFLELQRSLFLDKNQIPKTFGNVNIDKSLFPDDNLTEFEEGNLPKDFSPNLVNYIEKTAQEMEINYMKNGLSREEVELRKKTYGPNSLPEKKKTPGIILFLEEITSTFSLLLWIAAALSFLAFGLSPEEKSNLYLAIVFF